MGPNRAYALEKRKDQRLSGTVLILKGGCTEVLNPANVEGIQLAPGSLIHPPRFMKGKDLGKSGFKGNTALWAIEDTVEMIEYPETVWWARIRNAQGQIGWSNQSENFDNKDRFGR